VNNSGRSTRIRKQGESHGKFVVEALEVGCEDLTCDLKTFFICNIWSEWFNETVIVPVL
jgi:hypothetical protein